jgi:predicted N-acyltransferase
MAIVRDFLKSMNLNPEEILSKEAQAMPHRTVIDYSHQPSEQEQIDTMLRALMHKLKQDIIAETREISQKKRYKLQYGNGSPGDTALWRLIYTFY